MNERWSISPIGLVLGWGLLLHLLPEGIAAATVVLAAGSPAICTGVIFYVVLNQLLPVARRTTLGVPLFLGVSCLVGVIQRLGPHGHQRVLLK